MKKSVWKFRAKIWLYPGANAWHFVSVPKSTSSVIKKAFAEKTRGWGSLPVLVTLGKTSWNTSIFPDSKSGTYLLPLKAQVRAKEGVAYDDTVSLTIKIEA